MKRNKREDRSNSLRQFDVERMINEGLAGGWEGERLRNGQIGVDETTDLEAPPTLNGKPIAR